MIGIYDGSIGKISTGKDEEGNQTYVDIHCGKTIHPFVIELERYRKGNSTLQEAFTNIYMYSKGDTELYDYDSLQNIAITLQGLSRKLEQSSKEES